MRVTVATAPCSWGVWYPDGAPSMCGYETFLDQAEQAGYSAIELGPVGYLPTDPETLGAELGRRGIEVCAGTFCRPIDQVPHFDSIRGEIADLCRRLQSVGAHYLVAMDESDVGLYSEKKRDMERGVWERHAGIFTKIGEFTREEYGIETVFHPHIKSLVETEEEILRLMECTGLSLCLDIGHHAYVNGGSDPDDLSALTFLEKFHEKIPYIHFKNVDAKIRKRVIEERLDSDTAFDLDIMCDLEDGIVNYVALRAVLERIDFNGFCVVEQDIPGAKGDVPFLKAQKNLEYLKRIGVV